MIPDSYSMRKIEPTTIWVLILQIQESKSFAEIKRFSLHNAMLPRNLTPAMPFVKRLKMPVTNFLSSKTTAQLTSKKLIVLRTSMI